MIIFRSLERLLTGEWVQAVNPLPKGLANEEKLEDRVVWMFTSKGYSYEYQPQCRFKEDNFCRKIDLLNPTKNNFAITRQLTFSNHKKAKRGLKLQRPDLLIYVNKEPIGIIELKSPNRPWSHCKKEAKDQINRYSKTINYFFRNMLIAIVTNGHSLEYSFPPFRKWNYISNANQFLELILQKPYFLSFLLLAEAKSSRLFQEELLDLLTKN